MTGTADELLSAARAWIEGDPDPQSRAELSSLLQARAFAELADRLRPLSFGTAGLRGPVGAGSGRMNLAVVIRAAYGIACHVRSRSAADHPIVIGFDARPTSRAFAEASAGVLLAAGFRVVACSTPTATPIVAFIGRELEAAISIVVTASHNPRGDNGYKVYGANAVQIISPEDESIALQIAAAPAARDVPRLAVDFAAAAISGLTLVTPELEQRYFDAVSQALPPSRAGRTLPIVHSALHGVGSAPMLRTLNDAGFTQVEVVAEQAAPDGTFPTTPFPNPEEPGTLDLALAEGNRRGAALVLINDPDADRLAAVARLDGLLSVLDGNQVGALLCDYLLDSAGASSTPLVLGSVVSSPLVALLCRARGAHYERTHTGFKWLWNAALELERAGAGRFCFGYEEALGYSVFPAVRDKDGLAAGRALAELAAALATRGATLFDQLFELYARHGLWASAARNVALAGADAAQRIAERLDALRASSDLELGPERITRVIDYRVGAEARPAWLGPASLLELELSSGSRLFVRPSGTEPKLKLYAHVRREIAVRADLAGGMSLARSSAAALLLELERALRF